jgi:hypothetical protein
LTKRLRGRLLRLWCGLWRLLEPLAEPVQFGADLTLITNPEPTPAFL